MNSSVPQRSHFPQLDGLRGIAILLVMVEHYTGRMAHLIPIGAGSMGVNLFFCLSGFLITSGLLATLYDGQPKSPKMAAFYIKRFFRLAPIYYCVLAALWLFDIPQVRSGLAWHVSYLSNVWVSFGGRSTIFWSLAVEEQFYLVFPLIMLFSARQNLIRNIIVAIIACLAFKIVYLSTGATFNWRLLPSAAEPLLLGCILAVVINTHGVEGLSPSSLRRFRFAAILAFGIAIAVWFTHSGILRHLTNQLLCGIFFAWIVFGGVKGFDGLIGWGLSNKALQFVGKISYGLYLIHSFVPDILRRLVPGLSFPIMSIATLLAVFFICTLSFFYFEQPLIRWGRQLAGRFDRAKGPHVEMALR